MPGVDSLKARLTAVYALSAYLPVSRAAARFRRLSRGMRGKAVAETRLSRIGWRDALPKGGPKRAIRVVESEKRFGNVNLSELAILAAAAAETEPGSRIVEIGTFDGRTTLNLAVNAPPDTAVLTLDLPQDHDTAYRIEESERPLVQKSVSGERVRSCSAAWRDCAERITQVFGDSASFDWSPYYAGAGLVFVDGSHAYDYARKDSETAFRLVRPRGLVIWHDYGVWPGVTRALDEIEASQGLGLRHIRGTSLVLWRAPDASAGHGRKDELHLPATAKAGEASQSPAAVGR